MKMNHNLRSKLPYQLLTTKTQAMSSDFFKKIKEVPPSTAKTQLPKLVKVELRKKTPNFHLGPKNKNPQPNCKPFIGLSLVKTHLVLAKQVHGFSLSLHLRLESIIVSYKVHLCSVYNPCK